LQRRYGLLVLGIDTSCDDTSASVLDITDKGAVIISNVVSNQEMIHRKYGGVVPELASRRHIEMIWPVVEEALGETRPEALSTVSVCFGPGLIGSLLVGCSFSKAMSYSTGVPLVAVNHLEGHVLSAFLSEEAGQRPAFPFLSLVVSGGHTSLYRVDGYCEYKELGSTRDDAAGEAYDKVSKLLGMGYPGGPEIDAMAREGNPDALKFPRAYIPESLDFSFSGLKNAVRLAVINNPGMSRQDISASFQASVVDVLVRKTEWAIRKHRIKRVALSGGVAANRGLREKMSAMAAKRDVGLYLPPVSLCTDNAAMIALAGYHRFMRGETAGLDLNPKAHLPLGSP
jgi:N6-L-threonylcarbamoyladenine synthase